MRSSLCRLLIAFVVGSPALLVVAPQVWRVAETIPTLPIGAEVPFHHAEAYIKSKGLAADREAGFEYHMELVDDDNLVEFLHKRRPSLKSHLVRPVEFALQPSLCKTGRFLLNDPRVGLLHNQRLSYQTALQIASSLDRILVMPGFFKFPHPEPYAGIQWVPARRLFDLRAIRECYDKIVEVEELINLCGAGILDGHTTVPFQTMWMRSAEKAPWINGTRPELVWAPPQGKPIHRFQSKETMDEVYLDFWQDFGSILASFLRGPASAAQVVRAHGLIVNNETLGDRLCFAPSEETMQMARRVQTSLGFASSEKGQAAEVLALHIRVFKSSIGTSGGYLQPEMKERQSNLCNIEPQIWCLLVAISLEKMWENFWPSHVYLASNEADTILLAEYTSGFPGVRWQPYSIAQYDAAVTIDESVDALQSVLVDAILCAWSRYFIGNICSTMSQYIVILRDNWGRPWTDSYLMGGDPHQEVLTKGREIVLESSVIDRLRYSDL